MRMPPNRRGAHPKQRSSSLRAWFFDETTGVASPSVWGTTGENLIDHLTATVEPPYICSSPIGMGREFVGADVMGLATETPGSDTTSIAAFKTQTVSVGCWMYVADIAPAPPVFSTVLKFSGPSDSAAAADNCLFRMSITTSPVFEIFTEDGVGSVSTWRSTYQPPMNRWIYVCFVRKAKGGLQVDYDLYVNGRFMEQMGLQSGTWNTPGGGANAEWNIGGQVSSAGAWGQPFSGKISGVYAWSESLTATQIEEDYRRGLLLPFHTSQSVKVAIEKPDSDGTEFYYDATDLDGLDFVSGLSTSNSPDNACVQGTVKFLREQENLSLAYFKNDTRLNLQSPDSDLTTTEKFIEINRGIKIYTATMPLGIQASGSDYWQFLDGTIDGVDWGTEETSVMFRDKGGVLVDTFIETDAYYGGGGDLAEDVMGDILTANSDTNKTDSYVDPGAPVSLVAAPYAWAVNQYKQKREPVMVAIRTIAGQFGHDVKYRWDEVTESFKLVLYEPERDSLTISSLFSPEDIKSVSKAELAGQRIRNVVRVSYDSGETDQSVQDANVTAFGSLPSGITYAGPSASVGPPPPFGYEVNGTTTPPPNVDEEGEETPGYVELKNDASMAAYGRRFMEVQESSTSQINTVTEAIKMGISMILDLSDPEFDHSVTIPIMPSLDIHDIIGFQPNSYLYTESQYLAVANITHNFQEDATTTISLRGKPNLGFKRWLALESRGAPNPANTPMEASNSLTKAQKLQSLQSVLGKSQMNLGGKFTQVRNNAFMTWADGRLNPPTGWSMAGVGDWDNTNIEASNNSKTGELSVEIKDAAYSIQSDLIPLDGYSNTPYMFEATWLRTGDPNLSLIGDVQFYDLNGATVGAAVPALNVTAGTAVWETQRASISPPAGNTARYARVIIAKSADVGSLYLDNVSVYPAARACNVSYNAGTGFSARLGLTTTNIKNIAYNVETPSPEFYDYGDNVASDEIAGTIPGSYFQVEESGIYEVAAKCAFDVTPSALTVAGDTLTITMYVFADAEYTVGTGIYTGAGSPRLVASQSATLLLPASAVNVQLSSMATVYTQSHFSYGEKISIAFSVDPTVISSGGLKGGASINPIDRCTTTLTTQYSSLTVKQRLLD